MTTTKSTSVKLAVRKHILSYFDTDMGWENTNKQANLADQIDYMRNANESTAAVALRLVDGGTFLAYYNQVQEFLNSLGINPEMKEYPAEKSWELYRQLVAREVVFLYEDYKYSPEVA